MNFSEFIRAHEGDDLGRLALSRGRFVSEVEDFDLALTTLEVRRKLRDKVPEWYAVPSLRYPLRLSGEQCSSTVTARYKAAVASALTPQQALWAENACCQVADDAAASTLGQKRLLSGKLADLTGGLGVDSWAFAQVFGEVLYNEMRPELADAAARNFRELGVTNITVKNCELMSGNVAQVLDRFGPDVLFLDPARRASDGHKVFRLEDCRPDVLQLLPELLAACPRILLKLSPMADISLVCKQLGCVKAVHVVAAEGECKELLLVLEKDWTGPHSLTVVENGAVMEIPGGRGDIPQSVATLGRVRGRGPSERMGGVAKRRLGDAPSPPGNALLFEPGKALLKAGAFDLPCAFGLEKLGRHTHLYTGAVPEELRPFGKVFTILETVPLDKRNIKVIGQKYPQAEVTARNIPLTSDQLRAKLGVRSGGGVHIFGVHQDASNQNLLIVTGT